MGLFPHSYNNLYMLVAVDFVSKWVEATVTPPNDTKDVMKNIFTTFSTQGALLSDIGTHFFNNLLEFLLKRYGAFHKVATAYHP